MEIKELKDRSGISPDRKLADAYAQFNVLLTELRKRALSENVVNGINAGIDEVNSIRESGKSLKKQLRKQQAQILKLIEKEHKLVTKNHYRNTWLAVGMAAFGIPLGVAFGASMGNMAFIGIGMPVGMAIGIAVGTAMDKKAVEEGRQLNLDVQ
ncbi:MAG: hypothetical protein GYB31_09435 [Bacteroidetes bacterium]|nr:hypothetical protein [Bacteroidota bacterium]